MNKSVPRAYTALSPAFVKLSMPLPVQHQNLSYGRENTLKNPPAMG